MWTSSAQAERRADRANRLQSKVNDPAQPGNVGMGQLNLTKKSFTRFRDASPTVPRQRI